MEGRTNRVQCAKSYVLQIEMQASFVTMCNGYKSSLLSNYVTYTNEEQMTTLGDLLGNREGLVEQPKCPSPHSSLTARN